MTVGQSGATDIEWLIAEKRARIEYLIWQRRLIERLHPTLGGWWR